MPDWRGAAFLVPSSGEVVHRPEPRASARDHRSLFAGCRLRSRGEQDNGAAWRGTVCAWPLRSPNRLANGRAANYQDASANDPSTAIAEFTCFGVGAFSYLAGSHQAAHRRSRRFGPHRVAISAPVASYFRVNLLEFFSAFNAHSRRHLWQADNVRRIMLSSTQQNQAKLASQSGHRRRAFPE